MAYTKTQLNSLGLFDLDQARKKIVNISLFDYIDDISLSDKTKNSIDYTYELYRDYLNELHQFSDSYQVQILKSLMTTEVIDNHVVEKENIDLLKPYSETHHSTAIRYLLKKLKIEDGILTDSVIKKAHEILMRGTSNEEEILSGFRNNNNYYVGYIENGERVILYLPISYDEINQAMKLFFDYYNAEAHYLSDLFVRPFVIHGLLAALQVFEDGNTRLARTIQHAKLLITTNQLIDSNLSSPAIYFSKAYIPYREEYRKLIADIALHPNYQTWENWIAFNLKRLQDQIYANEIPFGRIRKK